MNIVVEEIEIHPSNSCLADYNQFTKLSSSELAAVQGRYYRELHQLQHELDELLNDLRQISLNYKRK
ncbi:hypothetical protein [Paenibacillus periandrae]|uniref:hypothetical protein n=1 Tax=Paenibacillus periandrae TaxID=1761741 RepID=UPI001F08C77D|nr:hypothetical protein [Paenibacillus periandrae]